MTNVDKTMSTNDEKMVVDNSEETVNDNVEAKEAETQEGGESVDELKKKLNTAIKQKNHWRDKAQSKSEEKKEDVKEAAQPEKSSDLTSRDTIAIMNAKVHEDDIDEVIEYAKFKGMSVSDALKDNVVKTILKEKEEYRKTAAATNTEASRKGKAPASGNELMTKLSKGDVPTSKEDSEALFWARRGRSKE